jgi:hypothetical protein
MNGRALLVGSVLGALVLFAWGAVMHAALPWPGGEPLALRDEMAVLEVLRTNALANGVYLGERGVFMALSRRPDLSNRVADMGPYLVREAVVDVSVALLLGLLLARVSVASVTGKAGVAALAALAAGVAGDVSAWNWYGFSLTHVTHSVFEQVSGWFLAGLVVAWAQARRPRT